MPQRFCVPIILTVIALFSIRSVGCNQSPQGRWTGVGTTGMGTHVSDGDKTFAAYVSVEKSLPDKAITFQYPLVIFETTDNALSIPPGYGTRVKDGRPILFLYFDPKKNSSVEDYYVDVPEASIVVCDLYGKTYRVIDGIRWPPSCFGDKAALKGFVSKLIVDNPRYIDPRSSK